MHSIKPSNVCAQLHIYFINLLHQVSEACLYESLSKTCSDEGLQLLDFSSTESVYVTSDSGDSSSAPFYHVFVAYNESEQDAISAGDLAGKLDSSLRESHPVYESYRAKGSIGGPTVTRLREEDFARLHSVVKEESGASENQFKMPRVLRKEAYVKVLQDFIH